MAGTLDARLRNLSGMMQILIGLGATFCGICFVMAAHYTRSGQLIFSLGTSIAIFFIIWWVMLFAVLPFGVRSQHEAGRVEHGSDPGAPARPHLLWYVLVNSALATCVSVVFLLWLAPLL